MTPTKASLVSLVRHTVEPIPVGLFGSVMGLVGLSISWRLAAAQQGFDAKVANVIALVAVLVFVVLTCAYGLKVLTSWSVVRSEFTHPIAGHLFGTVWISLLLLPIELAPHLPNVARVMWGVGALGMLVYAWVTLNRWLSDRQKWVHATPPWIIPVVGLLDLPLALPTLGLPVPQELPWLAMSVGLFFMVSLFTVIFARLVFEEAFPDALRPSLMILLAPFVVGASACMAVMGEVNALAQALYLVGVFLFFVLLGQLRHLMSCCPFRVSWWAVSFPLAALSIAAHRYAMAVPSVVAQALATAFWVVATVVIAGLFVRTIWGLVRGELRTLTA
jgi:tellurite resistance protein